MLLWNIKVVLMAGGVVVGLKVGGKIREKVKIGLKSKIETKLRQAFGEDKNKKNLRNTSMCLISKIVGGYRSKIVDSLKDQVGFFEERVEKAKTDFEQSEAERRKLAGELNVLRTTKISPVKEKVDSFLKDVLHCLDS